MKFIHVADIHLGAIPEKGKPWAENREREIWDTFIELIKRAEKEQVDFLFIAGDLFHRQPLLRELKEVNYLFSTLGKTKVILMAGNHDYIRRDSYYRNFDWEENVSFLKSPRIERVYFPEENVEVYGGSYYDKKIREPIYDRIMPIDKTRINILIAHGGDEKHAPMNERQLALNGFDYIALGHRHTQVVFLENRIINPGNIEPLDINETGKKGYFIGELTKETCHTQFIPLAKRNYIHLHIKVKTSTTLLALQRVVEEKIEELGKHHMYKLIIVGFREEGIQYEEENLLRLGNICQVVDNTEPDYDLEDIYQKNKNNMLGMYVKRFTDKDGLTKIERKALNYGIRALSLGE
ncbi:MAG: DNA repair exonuclease [Clostridiales bacterium]|nr:DNA repair exonuclease [Clostridiales bacterium]